MYEHVQNHKVLQGFLNRFPLDSRVFFFLWILSQCIFYCYYYLGGVTSCPIPNLEYQDPFSHHLSHWATLRLLVTPRSPHGDSTSKYLIMVRLMYIWTQPTLYEFVRLRVSSMREKTVGKFVLSSI